MDTTQLLTFVGSGSITGAVCVGFYFIYLCCRHRNSYCHTAVGDTSIITSSRGATAPPSPYDAQHHGETSHHGAQGHD